MRTLSKILWIIACLGVLIGAIYLFYPKPTRRPILPGGSDPDTVRQDAVDSMDKAISDFSAQRKIVEDYQRRQSSRAATPGAQQDSAKSPTGDSNK
jgi:hypothetical protein